MIHLLGLAGLLLAGAAAPVAPPAPESLPAAVAGSPELTAPAAAPGPAGSGPPAPSARSAGSATATPPTPEKAPALVDATAIVPGLVLDIRYATDRNFLGRRLYDAPRCLLHPSVADRLARAAATLAEQGFHLKAWDCYRPRPVQQALWDAMPVRGLVAPPARGGSHHNRAAAVDVTLVRPDGGEVEMPTDHDAFVKAAYRDSPLPSAAAKRHRDTLQKAMTGAGFRSTRMEWWHFDAPDARTLPTLDVPLSTGAPPPTTAPPGAILQDDFRPEFQ